MKHWQITLAILAALSASLALAQNFTTINGKEYKNATVIRVEPDGLMVKFSGGLVKIPFVELPKELQEKYHYDPEASQKFAADSAAAINARNAVVSTNTTSRKEEQQVDRLLQQVRIFAVIKPYHYGKEQTTAYIQEYAQYWKGPTASDFGYSKVGEQFTGVIDERMSEAYERGDTAVVTLYKIGHSNDSSRDPLFTTNKEKAMRLVLGRE